MANFAELRLNQDGYQPQNMILVISKPMSGKGENHYYVVSDEIEAKKAFSYYYNPIDRIPIKVYINKNLRESIKNHTREQLAKKAIVIRKELGFLLKIRDSLIKQNHIDDANTIKNIYEHFYEYYDILMDKSKEQNL